MTNHNTLTQEQLATLAASQSADLRLRVAAILRISDPNILSRLMETETNPLIRHTAFHQMGQFITRTMKPEH